MKEGSSNRASISEGLHEGDLEGSFTGDPKRYVKSLEMVCFHSVPAFGKHGGALFIRAFE
jgi:hypothetical protein